MKKEDLIPKILEILQSQAEATADLIDIMTSGYSESYRKARKTLKYGPRRFESDWADTYRENQIFYSLLNQLKKNGFIEKEKNKSARGSVWHITRKGSEWLHEPKAVKEKYGGKPDGKTRIIMYDIPERNRKNRNWLRSVLKEIDFSFLQESVWLGLAPVSEEFMRELQKRGIVKYIHIVEISKEGTVKLIKT